MNEQLEKAHEIAAALGWKVDVYYSYDSKKYLVEDDSYEGADPWWIDEPWLLELMTVPLEDIPKVMLGEGDDGVLVAVVRPFLLYRLEHGT